MYPDSPDAYWRLINAIDRKAFAVHLDPVNLVNSPQRYFSTGRLIEECVAKLGAHIKSCHAKDILLRENLTVHLDESGQDREFLITRSFSKRCDAWMPTCR